MKSSLQSILAEDRPEEIEDADREAHERGPWRREHIDRGVRCLPKDARTMLLEAIDRG